jgi:hypothetical protein
MLARTPRNVLVRGIRGNPCEPLLTAPHSRQNHLVPLAALVVADAEGEEVLSGLQHCVDVGPVARDGVNVLVRIRDGRRCCCLSGLHETDLLDLSSARHGQSTALHLPA